MTYLIIGLLLFLGVHSTSIFAPAWRNAMVAKLGDAPWKALYSIVSVIGFVMLVHGYAAARAEPVVLYTPPLWTYHLVALLMLPVFPLLFSVYLPGRIKAAVKHPMLTATKAWALAHLLANGNLADVLLFGGFLAWAVLDRISVGKRAVPNTSSGPAVTSRFNDVIAVVAGLAVYAVVAHWAHLRFIGVSPVLPH